MDSGAHSIRANRTMTTTRLRSESNRISSSRPCTTTRSLPSRTISLRPSTTTRTWSSHGSLPPRTTDRSYPARHYTTHPSYPPLAPTDHFYSLHHRLIWSARAGTGSQPTTRYSTGLHWTLLPRRFISTPPATDSSAPRQHGPTPTRLHHTIRPVPQHPTPRRIH